MSLSLLVLALLAAIGFFQLGALTVWTMVLSFALRSVVGVVVLLVVSGLGYLAWRRYHLRKPKKASPSIILP